MRIARGSGRQVRDLMAMLEVYKHLAKGFKIPRNALSGNMKVEQMSRVVPPQMLKQIGGMGGLQNLMKQMGSAKDMMGMFGGGDK